MKLLLYTFILLFGALTVAQAANVQSKFQQQPAEEEFSAEASFEEEQPQSNKPFSAETN